MTISFDTEPDRYKHWKFSVDGRVAYLHLDVAEEDGLDGDYRLKLNSYDLGVDIELADALQRIRFEHPEVGAVVLGSAKDRVFCSGANIYMLGASTHAFKVNFCKFTNETRLSIEDASEHSGLKFICAVNGPCAGGGYELALAADEIILVDDGSSAVSLPEVPLLGVLPGTGGLTRLVDKRKVRRDRADFFSTVAEGVRGKRALEWGLVDAVYPRSKFDQAVQARAAELAEQSDRPAAESGIKLTPLAPKIDGELREYNNVRVELDRGGRVAHITLSAPGAAMPRSIAEIVAAGDQFWPLAVFRELDDALLDLRFNEAEIGTLVLHTKGDAKAVLAADAVLAEHRQHWFVREVLLFIKRTLKRLDLTARSLVALIEPGSCFAGTFFELALAADRTFMLDDPDNPVAIELSMQNAGSYPMSNGLSRLKTRFLGEPELVEQALATQGPLDPQAAMDAGLVTFIPDELDWEDEVRLAIEERVALSPDALTGMEASLRFAGPETLETKIFGRLSAWQNWIFQRPNAVGEKGALTLYGQAGMRPEFDWRRT
ncbi:MAG: benzoyl-CoA-dihydrodiol lyase [Deltaproteobacteria bacterium]|nr:benzoyl-CoA-dihydrodiol lyase [Deltaproteobacteria bacterium]